MKRRAGIGNDSAAKDLVAGAERKPRPLIPYPGGKWYARRLIIPKFPIFTAELVSPFLGGGSIELTVAARGCRVYGSDIYDPLVNFYQHALSCPAQLADNVADYYPMDRERFAQAALAHKEGRGSPLTQAARWYALIRTSYSGRIIEYTPGNFSGHPRRFTEAMIDTLRNFRSPAVTVERMDWRQALDAHPCVFAYLDPPYPSISRKLYVNHRNFDHVELRDILAARQAPWALSINDLPETRKLYSGFRIEALTWNKHIHNPGAGLHRGTLQELLVTNY